MGRALRKAPAAAGMSLVLLILTAPIVTTAVTGSCTGTVAINGTTHGPDDDTPGNAGDGYEDGAGDH